MKTALALIFTLPFLIVFLYRRFISAQKPQAPSWARACAQVVIVAFMLTSCGGDFMQFNDAETPNFRGLPVRGTFYFQSDHVNSTDMLTNESGEPVSRVAYTPYGEKSGFTGEDVFNKKYTGQTDDGETGLLYYKARYYDPAIGRFITADTVIPDPSYSQSYNRYMYVIGNPVNYNDPSGHFSIKKSIKRFVNNNLSQIVGTVVGFTFFGPIGAAIGLGVGSIFKKSINNAARGAYALAKDVRHSMHNLWKNEIKNELKQTWNNNAWVRIATYVGVIVAAIAVGAVLLASGNPYPLVGVILGFYGGFFYGNWKYDSLEKGLKYAAIGAVTGFVAGWLASPNLNVPAGVSPDKYKGTFAPEFLGPGRPITWCFAAKSPIAIGLNAFGKASTITGLWSQGQLTILGFGYDIDDNHPVIPW